MLGARLLGDYMVRTVFRGVYLAGGRGLREQVGEAGGEREYSCSVPTIQARSMVR
jgi:hypothetical protein